MLTDTLLPNVIYEQHTIGQPVVLISIVDLQGSSPRHRGTKMVVCADGKCYGTIGGSIFEAEAVEEAKKVIDNGESKFMDFSFDDSEKYPGGMICGGKAVVLLDYIPVSEKNISLFHHWYDLVKSGIDFYFITQIINKNDGVSITGHSLLFADGRSVVSSDSVKPQIKIEELEIRNITDTTIVSVENGRMIVDPIKKLQTLYCFGAGHVAVPTVHIAALVGFRVIVLDDRDEFANKERFPDAEQLIMINDYNKAFERLEIDRDSYIVIMTRGHQYDQILLEQALKTQACYIGMISSRKKRNSVYRALQAKGIKKQELERVHSPIGIAIKSETPEEIAVSIVAQVIKERARRAK